MAFSVLWKNFWIVLAVWDVECYEYQLEDTMQKKGLIPPPPHQLTSIANCHTYVVITKLIFVCIRTSTDRFDVTCLLNTGVTIRHSSLWKNFTPTPTEYKKNCWRPKKAQQRTKKLPITLHKYLVLHHKSTNANATISIHAIWKINYIKMIVRQKKLSLEVQD